MARDRKRAKQRRERRAHGGRSSQAAAKPSRADVPGALDHASSDVDEFDAALVRGAAARPEDVVGVAATPEPEVAAEPESELAEEFADGSEDALQVPRGPGGGDGDGAGGGAGGGDGDHERPSGAPLRGGNRALAFVRASWAELQRVQWPDRRQVTQATAVVLGFVAIAGAYLGLADYVAKEIVEFVL